MDLGSVLDWARKAFPLGDLPTGGARPKADLTSFQRAVATLAEAFVQGPSADPQYLAFKLGAGLNGLAYHLREQDQEAPAELTFRIALTVLSDAHADRNDAPEHFKKAIAFAESNLRKRNAEISTLQELPAAELLIPDLPQVIAEIFADQQTESGDSVSGPHGFAATRSRQVQSLAEILIDVTSPLADHSNTSPIPIEEAKAFLATKLTRTGILERDLGRVLSDDITKLAALFPSGHIPSDIQQLTRLARDVRRSAFDGRIESEERRLRWLTAALTNLTVWKLPSGISTNEPQILIDFMGYVGSVILDRRYSDVDRDLLLDCGEAQVRLAASIAPVVLARFDYLRKWLRAAVGTYLLLAGPDPSQPQDSYYDERIQSETAPVDRGLKRAERADWSEILLNQWQRDSDRTAGATYALASVAGWDLTRSQWLVRQLFAESADERRNLNETFWLEHVGTLMSRVARVRVATNPWAQPGGVNARSTMISSDERGRFIIPDPVLRAAASQGLLSDGLITVHGSLFAGRRVPTYLLTNRFGPYALLKIDHRDKIIREVRNFDSYARRLHQSNRPSECKAHTMDIYLGEDGSPLRAIETSYVFEEHDRPLTLGAWMRAAELKDALYVVDRLLLTSLRPWLAHVRRDRIDLRDEYPILRSAPAPEKQSPDNWCESEVDKILCAEVAAIVGASPDVGLKERTPAEPASDSQAKFTIQVIEDRGFEAVNPIWLCSEIGEIGSGQLSWLVDSLNVGLRDFDTLLTLTHGDLHLDNVLCTSGGSGTPKTVLIDFESAHYGHVCKDIARLEAAILCQAFEFTPEETRELIGWYVAGLLPGRDLTRPPRIPNIQGRLELTMALVEKIRKIGYGCGQAHWPLHPDEYRLALLGVLLPMVRYSTLTRPQRELAYCLALAAGSFFLASSQQIESNLS